MNTKTQDRRNFLAKAMLSVTGGVALLSGVAQAKTVNATELTQEQKDKLFFIYEEEKVARDVYITLGKLYPNENTFASIQLSEQRHIDSAQGLCETYGVDISSVDEESVGNFVLPVLQELYDSCVSMGSESLLSALQVGKLIEETDIQDLEDAMVGMPSDVVSVYSSLQEGSFSHLDAFNTAIAQQS